MVRSPLVREQVRPHTMGAAPTMPAVLRDRDVFQDAVGGIYVAIGHIQPTARTVSYLKYVPDPHGRWQVQGRRYRRVFSNSAKSVADAMHLVPGAYLVEDRHFNTVMVEVPHSCVVEYYSPEARLAEIIDSGPGDRLEGIAATIAMTIHDLLGVPFSAMGVTGSIAWRAHDPSRSDVNFNVYGYDVAHQLVSQRGLVVSEDHRIRLRRGKDWTGSVQHIVDRVDGMSVSDIQALYARKTEFVCDGQYVTVMPVLRPHESPVQYGMESYHRLVDGTVRVTLQVEDDRYGIFMPAIYTTSSRPLDITGGNRITRLMIYDGSFRDTLRTGDVVQVQGTLQRVVHSTGSVSFQMMVGTMQGCGHEYIRLTGHGR